MIEVSHPATPSFPVRDEQAGGDLDLAAMAKALSASGRYRVQRRLAPRRTINPPDGSATRTALFVDVETTGLDSYKDEIIELAMVPFTYGLDGRIFEIGEPFERFQEPKRPIPANITQLTGITDAMVAGQRIDPDEVSTFASRAALVIAHNAAFDRGFVNHELGLAGRPELPAAQWIDTLGLAQKRFPGLSNSLDSLCRRFKISLAEREKHGALIDARLLAGVYLELRGGRERRLDLEQAAALGVGAAIAQATYGARPRPLAPRLTDAERAAHEAFVANELRGAVVWLSFEAGGP